ncbi:MAG: alpha/beta hydrolase-fold protein [Opitutales bacterium]
MKRFTIISLIIFGFFTLQVQAVEESHKGQYQKNLKYKGPVTGDEIIYTLYLPPGHSKDKGPYPLIVFLHGAGGGNASLQVMQSYEAARTVGKIGDCVVVFPEKYGGTVWRDGAKDKRAETNVLKELLPYLEKEYALSSGSWRANHHGFFHGGGWLDLLGGQVPRHLFYGSGSRRRRGDQFYRSSGP